MKVTRQSLLTGKVHSMELPVSPLDLDAYHSGTANIQDVFPHLTDEQREFIKSGITPEEWATMDGGASGTSMTSEYRGAYDERVRILNSDNRPITSVPYHIRTASGGVYKGLTDASGYCPRVYTDDVSQLDIAVGMKALERWSATL